MNENQSPCIEIEVPSAWCEHPLVGAVHRHFVANLFGVLADLHAVVTAKPVRSGDDFVPRSSNSILLSYHSVGDSPNVWRIKEGPLPYYFSFDRRGYSGWSELARSPEMQARAQQISSEDAQRIVRKIREESIERNVSKYPQPTIATNALPAEYVFFPLQIASDTVLQLSRLDYFDVLTNVACLARQRRENLVVKRHPLCDNEEMARIVEALHACEFVTITEASIHQCIAGAKSVLCCNSGVGFEALLHGKPVFCFGGSDYGAAAEQIMHLDEMDRVFDVVTSITADARDRFLAYFMTEYCFDARSTEDIAVKVRKAILAAGQDRNATLGSDGDAANPATSNAWMPEIIAEQLANHPQITRLEEQLREVSGELAALQHDTRSARAASNAELARVSVQLSSEFEKMLAQRDQADEDRRRLDAFVDALRGNVAQADARADALRGDVARADARVDALRGDVAQANAELAASRSETQAWRARAEALQNSRTWRATAPLRRVAGVLRGGVNAPGVTNCDIIPAESMEAERSAPVEPSYGAPGSKPYEKILASGLFDKDWYLSQYSDVAQAGIDPIEHYLTAGAAERRQPGAFFDAGFYLWVYPDLGASGVNPLLHYIEYGSRENRTPHPLFDVEWFKATSGFDPDSDETALRAYLRMAGTSSVWPTNLFARCQGMLNLSNFRELDGYIERLASA